MEKEIHDVIDQLHDGVDGTFIAITRNQSHASSASGNTAPCTPHLVRTGCSLY